MNIRPNLLISTSCDISEVPNAVFNAKFVSQVEAFFTSRHRGTKIVKTSFGYQIVAWFVTVNKIQHNRIYQPMVLSMELSADHMIKSCQLDERSIGSQGFPCSIKYLNRVLQETITGIDFDWKNYRMFLANQNHCFHLQEFLIGLLSCLDQMKKEGLDEFGEVEGTETIKMGDDLTTIVRQEFNEKVVLDWSLKISNIRNIRFGNNGYINRFDNINVGFCVGENIEANEVLNASGKDDCHLMVSKFLYQCWERLSAKVFPDRSIQLCHSGAYPLTFIAIFVLGVAIVRYTNNSNYFRNVAYALQRKDGKPLCIGMIDDIDEAKLYYPDFKMTDLYGE